MLSPAPEIAPAPRAPCPNCGAADARNFCPECGQKRLGLDESLRGIAVAALEWLTRFDARLVKSLGLLIARPGLLSAEHFAGKRVAYARPVQLYFLLVTAFVLTLDAPSSPNPHILEEWIARGPLMHARAWLVDWKLRHLHLAVADLDAHLVGGLPAMMKLLPLVSVPAIAFALSILFVRSRFRFLNHLVFATHLVTAWLLVGVFANLPYLFPKLLRGHMVDIISVCSTLAGFALLLISLRRAYALRWRSAMWRAPALGALIVLMFSAAAKLGLLDLLVTGWLVVIA